MTDAASAAVMAVPTTPSTNSTNSTNSTLVPSQLRAPRRSRPAPKKRSDQSQNGTTRTENAVVNGGVSSPNDTEASTAASAATTAASRSISPSKQTRQPRPRKKTAAANDNANGLNKSKCDAPPPHPDLEAPSTTAAASQQPQQPPKRSKPKSQRLSAGAAPFLPTASVPKECCLVCAEPMTYHAIGACNHQGNVWRDLVFRVCSG